jgi:flagellar protein FlaF
MAVAEIIGTAIGTMLIIIVAYLLVGNVLNAAEVVSNAQKDMTLLQESRLHTDLSITHVEVSVNAINLTITNTGTEIISDFPHTDVFVYTAGGAGYSEYQYNATNTMVPYSWSGSIVNDYVHPGELDPGETMFVNAYYPSGEPPVSFEVGICTDNGVYASTVV